MWFRLPTGLSTAGRAPTAVSGCDPRAGRAGLELTARAGRPRRAGWGCSHPLLTAPLGGTEEPTAQRRKLRLASDLPDPSPTPPRGEGRSYNPRAELVPVVALYRPLVLVRRTCTDPSGDVREKIHQPGSPRPVPRLPLPEGSGTVLQPGLSVSYPDVMQPPHPGQVHCKPHVGHNLAEGGPVTAERSRWGKHLAASCRRGN